MRIVDRQTFLALPEGTFYAKVDREPRSIGLFGGLCIKGESRSDDWWYINIVGIDADNMEVLIARQVAMRSDGAAFPMNEDLGRDGLFDADQMFLIFERGDLESLRRHVDQAIAAAP